MKITTGLIQPAFFLGARQAAWGNITDSVAVYLYDFTPPYEPLVRLDNPLALTTLLLSLAVVNPQCFHGSSPSPPDIIY